MLMQTAKTHFRNGYTLIELLVATIIGLFMITGMMSFFLANKHVHTIRSEISQLEEIGRSALFELSRTIQHTGYRGYSSALYDDWIITSALTAQNCAGNGVAETSTNMAYPGILLQTQDSPGTGSDSITVSYLGDGNLNIDCAGLSMPADCRLGAPPNQEAARIYSSFSIAEVDRIPYLQCASSLSASPFPLVPGVENMQLNYGVDEDGNDVVDRYITASSVADWEQVKTVRIGLLVRSMKATKNTASAEDFMVLDKKITSPKDRFRREVFQTTVRLQNINL